VEKVRSRPRGTDTIDATDALLSRFQVTDAVHARGSFIFLQIWGMGRAAMPSNLAPEGLPYVSSSAVPLETRPSHSITGTVDCPRPLTVSEIKDYVANFAQAAKYAVHGAGFDGVEVHGANGYLVGQFASFCSSGSDYKRS
jgi:NADPH2 dehydrogenase